MISVIPLGILWYIYFQIKESGSLQITVDNFTITLILVVIGVAVGYFAMNMVLKRLLRLTKENQNVLQDFLDDEKVVEIQSSSNEVAVLTKTFSEIRSKLEQNVEKLEMAKKHSSNRFG